MTSLPISNHMFQLLHFTQRILARVRSLFCLGVCAWLRQRTRVYVCVCLLGADGWPSVEGRVGGGLLLLWQVNADSQWIQMRRSPSLFHSLLRSFTSTPTCTNTGPYGYAPYTHTHTAHLRIPPTQDPALFNSWLIYIHKHQLQLTTFHYTAVCVSISGTNIRFK